MRIGLLMLALIPLAAGAQQIARCASDLQGQRQTTGPWTVACLPQGAPSEEDGGPDTRQVPDGAFLAVASPRGERLTLILRFAGGGQETIRDWEVTAGEYRWVFSRQQRPVSALTICPKEGSCRSYALRPR